MREEDVRYNRNGHTLEANVLSLRRGSAYSTLSSLILWNGTPPRRSVLPFVLAFFLSTLSLFCWLLESSAATAVGIDPFSNRLRFVICGSSVEESESEEFDESDALVWDTEPWDTCAEEPLVAPIPGLTALSRLA